MAPELFGQPKDFEMVLDSSVLEVSGNLDSEAFLIEGNATAYEILSKNIYTDIPRAIIRELCCNAIDANTAAGSTDQIEVGLPTEDKPSLTIKDFGVGMTYDDVMLVYKTYFKSTKRQSDAQIGAYGLGGKTPFAYTDQFVLTTACNGEENQFVIFKNENGIPQVSHLGKRDTNSTGTTVEMLVKHEDFDLFARAAVMTFAFFEKMPIITNGEKKFYSAVTNLAPYTSHEMESIFEKVRERLSNDYISLESKEYDAETAIVCNNIIKKYGQQTLGIVMGGVFYSVDINQIENPAYFEFAKDIAHYPAVSFSKLKVLHVPIGFVSTQASRESLNYTVKTKANLVNIFYKHFEDDMAEFEKNSITVKDFTKYIANCENRHSLDFYGTKEISPERTNKCHPYIKKLMLTFRHRHSIFDPIKGKKGLVIHVMEEAHKKDRLQSTNIGDYLSVDNEHSNKQLNLLFDRIFMKKTIKHMVLFEDKDEESLEKAALKARAKSNYSGTFLLSANIANRFYHHQMADKSLLVNAKALKELKKITNLMSVRDFSTMQMPKVPTGIVQTKAPRESKNKELPFYPDNHNWANSSLPMDNKSFSDIEKLVKSGYRVSWEVVNGSFSSRWTNIVNNELVRMQSSFKKSDVIYEDVKTSTSIFANSMSKLDTISRSFEFGNIERKKHAHFLIDFNTFKKYDLANMKGFPQTMPALVPYIQDLITKIETYLKAFKVTNEVPSINISRVNKYLEEYNNKYTGYVGTEFYMILKEIEKISTMVIPDENIILKRIRNLGDTIKLVLNGLQATEGAAYKDTVETFNNDIERLIKITMDFFKLPRVNMQHTMYERYPMLKYATIDSSNTVSDIIDYVALIDRLKLK